MSGCVCTHVFGWDPHLISRLKANCPPQCGGLIQSIEGLNRIKGWVRKNPFSLPLFELGHGPSAFGLRLELYPQLWWQILGFSTSIITWTNFFSLSYNICMKFLQGFLLEVDHIGTLFLECAQNSTLPKGKQVISINHIVCTNKLGTVIYSYNWRNGGNPPKI